MVTTLTIQQAETEGRYVGKLYKRSIDNLTRLEAVEEARIQWTIFATKHCFHLWHKNRMKFINAFVEGYGIE